MNVSQKIDRSSRAREKREARGDDAARLKAGEAPKVLQRENSIFPEGFFANARVSNRRQSLGR